MDIARLETKRYKKIVCRKEFRENISTNSGSPPANTRNCYSTLDVLLHFSSRGSSFNRLLPRDRFPLPRLEERILGTRSAVGQIPFHYENYGSTRNFPFSTFSIFRSSSKHPISNSFLGWKN